MEPFKLISKDQYKPERWEHPTAPGLVLWIIPPGGVVVAQDYHDAIIRRCVVGAENFCDLDGKVYEKWFAEKGPAINWAAVLPTTAASALYVRVWDMMAERGILPERRLDSLSPHGSESSTTSGLAQKTAPNAGDSSASGKRIPAKRSKHK